MILGTDTTACNAEMEEGRVCNIYLYSTSGNRLFPDILTAFGMDNTMILLPL